MTQTDETGSTGGPASIDELALKDLSFTRTYNGQTADLPVTRAKGPVGKLEIGGPSVD
jgi:hypothetical protein